MRIEPRGKSSPDVSRLEGTMQPAQEESVKEKTKPVEN